MVSNALGFVLCEIVSEVRDFTSFYSLTQQIVMVVFAYKKE